MGFIKFYKNDSTYESYQPPVPLNLPTPTGNNNDADYVIELVNSQIGEPFDFRIKRRSSGKILQVLSISCSYFELCNALLT